MSITITEKVILFGNETGEETIPLQILYNLQESHAPYSGNDLQDFMFQIFGEYSISGKRPINLGAARKFVYDATKETDFDTAIAVTLSFERMVVEYR